MATGQHRRPKPPLERTSHPGVYRRGSRFVAIYRLNGRQHKESAPTFAAARSIKMARDAESQATWRGPTFHLFHEGIPEDYIAAVFDVMERAHWHVFQVLTKREDRLAELARHLPWPENVWMGVSIENRRFVHRADRLREVDSAVRFISAEPLLGPLDGLDLAGIDWLIAGGESGPRHRRIDIEWLRSLREQCGAEGVAFFFKQWGGQRPKSNGRELDGRTWDEYPLPKDRSRVLV